MTKVELWECFRHSASRFSAVQVDVAHSIIGKNAPRYLEKKGYLVKESGPRGDFYKLTPDGETWLVSGIKAYAKNHPANSDSIPFFPEAAPIGRRIVRRR